ncbi:MAG: hypothetical protein ABEI75_04835 [Halobaculum sp.]
MSEPTVETAAAQVLAGITLAEGGKTDCADCGRTVREGDRVGVYARRAPDESRFDATRLVCRSCRRDRIDHPTPGVRELTAFGRLGVTTDDASRDARLTLRDPEVVAEAGVGE